jgi:DNA-binding LacI/PurR family transcriptional regulator/DNA-binding transcriptional regulator YhcF (GntR family)
MLWRYNSGIQQRLTSFLAELIDDHTRRNDPFLPPIRALAAKAGVSYLTMQRAIAALHHNGTLVARHGSGVVVRGIAPPQDGQPVARPNAHIVRQRLEMQVLSGQWAGDGALPSPKELRSQFGVSYRTVRNALRDLAARGYIEPWKHGYRVRPVAVRADAGTVVLIMRGGPDGEVVFASPRTRENLWFLEHECARAGVRLALVTAEIISRRWRFPDGNDQVLYRPAAGMGVLGYVLWTDSIAPPMLAQISPLLQASGCRVAVLDEGKLPSLLPGLDNKRIRRFVTAYSSEPGRQMGRLLLQLGHTHVGFLALNETAQWSQARFAGLAEVYAAAGLPHAVTRHASPLPAFRQYDSSGAFEALLKLLEKDLGAPARRQHALAARTLRSHAQDMRVFMYRETISSEYGLLVKDALVQARRQGCTAWIAENDSLAIAALAALKRDGLRIPQDMAMAGFDDSDEARESGLTSYNFNGAGYIHAMLRWVLETGRPARESMGEATEIDGFIVERRTTGRHAAGEGPSFSAGVTER